MVESRTSRFSHHYPLEQHGRSLFRHQHQYNNMPPLLMRLELKICSRGTSSVQTSTTSAGRHIGRKGERVWWRGLPVGRGPLPCIRLARGKFELTNQDSVGGKNSSVRGRFPFDQKFRKFRVVERMEQSFSGISFRNFGCTSRGWPKIPENRNTRKIPFHSTIPARA